MNSITIDLETCTGCRTCFKACFVNVIGWDRSRKRPTVSYPEDCVHCNYCELNCPEQCIAVIPDFERLRLPVL